MTITIREPGSAITHFIAMVLAALAAAPLLVKAAFDAGRIGVFSMAVFMTSMILLYGASTLYHSVNLSGHSLRLLVQVEKIGKGKNASVIGLLTQFHHTFFK